MGFEISQRIFYTAHESMEGEKAESFFGGTGVCLIRAFLSKTEKLILSKTFRFPIQTTLNEEGYIASIICLWGIR